MLTNSSLEATRKKFNRKQGVDESLPEYVYYCGPHLKLLIFGPLSRGDDLRPSHLGCDLINEGDFAKRYHIIGSSCNRAIFNLVDTN